LTINVASTWEYSKVLIPIGKMSVLNEETRSSYDSKKIGYRAGREDLHGYDRKIELGCTLVIYFGTLTQLATNRDEKGAKLFQHGSLDLRTCQNVDYIG
jgi:hypothetical protein